MPLKKVVFDLETQKEFSEVGGRGRNHLLKVSVAAAYAYPDNKFYVYEENAVHKLGELLQDADLVIGYNILNFDYEVLRPYLRYDPRSLPTLDMLVEVEKELGHRIGLDALASATLGTNKTASGLEAVRFWREGLLDTLKDYCIADVRITRDLYEYAQKHGKLYYKDFFDRRGIVLRFPEVIGRENKHRQISLF